MPQFIWLVIKMRDDQVFLYRGGPITPPWRHGKQEKAWLHDL